MRIKHEIEELKSPKKAKLDSIELSTSCTLYFS